MQDYPITTINNSVLAKYFGEIPDPPKQLFIRGTFPIDNHYVFLTVVGSRNYSSYGEEVCKQLIHGLQGYPIVIVSGLALGIDSISHHAALAAGLLTVAFPGSGLREQSIYPRASFTLARKILHHGGCLISEYSESESGNSWMFPRRNRLMAGLSRATLVIEATHKSGSRITAKLATDYNRDVLTVPGSIFSKTSEAPHELIRMGATPITSGSDILEALGFQITTTTPIDIYAQCSREEQMILEKLASPIRRGDLVRAISLPINKINVLISQMEVKGFIKDVEGTLQRC